MHTVHRLPKGKSYYTHNLEVTMQNIWNANTQQPILIVQTISTVSAKTNLNNRERTQKQI